MSGTNRDEEVRLTSGDPALTTTDYMNRRQPPSSLWSSLQLVLALVGIFVIVRSCVGLARSWFTSRPDNIQPSGPAGRLLDRQNLGHRQPGWAMDEKHGHAGAATPAAVVSHVGRPHVNFKENEPRKSPATGPIDTGLKAVPDIMARSFARRPPAPPLTPPEPSTNIFSPYDRPRSRHSFIHQPNPDYTSTSAPSSPPPATPKRRTYSKTMPIGIPTPQNSSLGASAEPLFATADGTNFSPSSYPPTSPLLPPAPPGTQHSPQEEDGRDVHVKGEIISSLDHEGAGWTRHTRVYGGGVCLACAAAGNHEGGFYGKNVTPEEMRYGI